MRMPLVVTSPLVQLSMCQCDDLVQVLGRERSPALAIQETCRGAVLVQAIQRRRARTTYVHDVRTAIGKRTHAHVFGRARILDDRRAEGLIVHGTVAGRCTETGPPMLRIRLRRAM